MKERVSWIQNGSEYKRVEGNVSNVDTIPRGVYNIGLSMTGWYLEYTGKEFIFDYKIYGLQKDFINHVMIAYNETKGNLGILLNGTKGTGKTVSAKVLANQLNLPIVIVKSFGENNQGLIEFLASFNFDCIFFFDEFEKNFSDKDSSILQIMDGVYTSEYRRIFLLTTNETTINDNLISRPSRLRYIHEFGNLEQEVVSEYLDDTLKDKSCKEDLIGFVDTLQISTIDILKSIVEEVNIFGFERFMETKHFFNVKTASYNYRTVRCYCANEEIAKLFTIDKFLAEVKIFEKNLAPNRYQYEDDEEYRKAYREYQKIAPTHDPRHQYLSGLNKSAKSVKIGDSWGYYNEEIVIAKDIDKKVIVTCEPGEHEYYYYFVENMDAKPSLYNDNAHLTNPYCIL